MSDAQSTSHLVCLAQHEGWSLFSAAEAMLKGVLESERGVELIAGPRSESFSPFFDLGREDGVSPLLAAHGTTLLASPDANRAVTLAAHAAASGHRAFALVPNDELDLAIPAMSRVCGSPLHSDGAMCLVLEDDPQRSGASCPRRAAMRLDVPCIEPGSLGQLRDSMEQAVRLCRAGRGVAAVVVHRSLLRTCETLEARPNRVMDRIDAILVRRQRRGPRWAEKGGVLRIARRLELNRATSLPSPGERLPVGLIVVGAAATALTHVVHVLHLQGRVPVLQLGLVHPIDDAVVQRMLGRCRQVAVLEPRPGSIMPSVLGVSEALRRGGKEAGEVLIPMPETSSERVPPWMQPDEAVHPSILARRIIHLLHTIRPGLQVASLLTPEPPELPVPPPGRGEQLGTRGAMALIRSVLGDVDQWLRDQEPRVGQSGTVEEPAALAIDGIEPAIASGRVVRAETWSHRRLLAEGIASLRQAAWDDRPWLIVICAVGARDPQDLERLARGVVPGERVERVKVASADLQDRTALRDLLREYAQADGVGVVIARDGPPPQYDVDALEQSRAEIDRLGYEPRQHLIWPAQVACSIRHPAEHAKVQPQPEPGAMPMRTRFSIGRLARTRPNGTGMRVRVRPLFEQVEVIRTRPPASTWRDSLAARLALPKPVHGDNPQWRAHLAGFRGGAPGVAARVLSDAGRAMGYQVLSIHDPAPIAPGLRAWAQVLFTHPRRDQYPVPLAATIPFGEADLLLGLEYWEALRAIDPSGTLRVANPDRTCAVVNTGPYADERDSPSAEGAAHRSGSPFRAQSRSEHRLIEDFAAACRTAFHTDRVADLALLGAAFRRGLIPVSLEAMGAAVERIEAQGFGRATEAFKYGCHLAADDRRFARPKGSRVEDVDRTARRTMLFLRRTPWGGRSDAARFAQLLQRTLGETPGLAETDPGRHARRDLVIALHRCHAWGGYDYAQQYAELITDLYRSDRGDKGRAITRSAVLPLGEAMLICDPIYVATMASSADHRRRTRQLLNVKLARGDRLERRYLTRIEIIAFRRRITVDVRSSDWPARIAALAKHLIPRQWRGTALQRQIRAYVIDVVKRAARGAAGDYERWSEIMQRLHDQAQEDRLRGMALSELRMLIEPEPQTTVDARHPDAAPDRGG